MKKVLLLLLFAAASISSAFAQYTTTDYMYTEGVKYDAQFQMSYFDVYMKGGEISYTAYGVDIQLPSGLQVVKFGDNLLVDKLDKNYIAEADVIYPQTLHPLFGTPTGNYSHTISFNEIEGPTHIRIGCATTASTNRNFTKTSGPLFRVYVEKVDASTSWPLGAIKFFDAKFVTEEAIGYAITDREDIVVLNEDCLKLPLKVSSAAKWSTCILPFAADIPEGVTAYTCSDADAEYIYLEKAESFTAYTPYILYAENGYDGNVSGTVEATIPENAKTGVVAGGYLNGAIVPQTATEGYVLQKHGDDVQFYAIESGDSFAIPAGKCWMSPIAGTESNVLSFRTDDMLEGINNITIPVSSLSFDLNGRQTTMDKGVIIKNGKKTLSL